MKIPIALNEELLQIGVSSFVEWDTDKAAHTLIVGASGSGKTHTAKLLLGRIALYDAQSKIFVSDFKADDDFAFLANYERFYRFDECIEGLYEIYHKLQARQRGEDCSRQALFYYFDEWPSFVSYLDKKDREDSLKKMSSLLMMGRSFRINVILSMQRADAQNFNAGARDNFGVIIAMGNLSTDSKEMISPAFKSQMLNDRSRGKGYILTNGNNLTKIIVPAIRDYEKLHRCICEGCSR
jgi:energy-coupling factor transporter ATP-binding protein EcfA2